MPARSEYFYVDTDADIYLARLVRQSLAAANRGPYPETPDEWNEVARRLGIRVRMDAQLSFSACLLDGLLLHAKGTDEQLARWLAHELAEDRLRSECEPPYILPPSCRDHYHHIARLVETLEE